MNYTDIIVGLVSALLVALQSWRIKQGERNNKTLREIRDEEVKQNQAIKVGVQKLLKSQILALAETIKQQEHITMMQKEMFDDCVKAYYDLGGNGVVHKIESQVNAYPLKIK